MPAPVLRKIIANEDLKLSDYELESLAVFVVTLVVRTPSFIKSQESMEEESMKEFMSVRAKDSEKFHEEWKEISKDAKNTPKY